MNIRLNDNFCDRFVETIFFISRMMFLGIALKATFIKCIYTTDGRVKEPLHTELVRFKKGHFILVFWYEKRRWVKRWARVYFCDEFAEKHSFVGCYLLG